MSPPLGVGDGSSMTPDVGCGDMVVDRDDPAVEGIPSSPIVSVSAGVSGIGALTGAGDGSSSSRRSRSGCNRRSAVEVGDSPCSCDGWCQLCGGERCATSSGHVENPKDCDGDWGSRGLFDDGVGMLGTKRSSHGAQGATDGASGRGDRASWKRGRERDGWQPSFNKIG
jgi:hypothetical protein